MVVMALRVQYNAYSNIPLTLHFYVLGVKGALYLVAKFNNVKRYSAWHFVQRLTGIFIALYA